MNEHTMKASRIIAIETANPACRMSQAESLDYVLKNNTLSPKAVERYQRFFGDGGISFRHFAIDQVKGHVFAETGDEAIARFQNAAVDTGTQAAQKVLHQAQLKGSQLGALIVTTCTGYLCPGLATHIAERLGLRDDAFFLDLVGQGCGAAGPALRAADQFVKSNPNSYAMVVCVEICSAAFAEGEEVDLLISNAIFADGAAAALVTDRTDCAGLELKGFQSLLLPEFRDDLRFKSRNSRLCNVISKRVPILASRAVKQLSAHLDFVHGAADHYAFHPGGRAVLDAVQNELGLTEQQMNPSRDVLRDFGNMSSPSVLFVLKHFLNHDSVLPGDRIFGFTFGAGFSAYAFSLICQTTGESHDGQCRNHKQAGEVVSDLRGGI